MAVIPKTTNALGSYDVCKDIAAYLFNRTVHRPTIGMVIGSGLAELANSIAEQVIIRYKDIPGFPIPTALGHKGRLIFGILGGKCVVCMQGRVHTYEGYHPTECALPIRVMKLLGVETLLLANAAGGLNNDFRLGDIMLITDHICLPAMTGVNPLTGINDERFGTRFPDMANCYSPSYVDLVKLSAARLNMGWRMRHGVYVMIAGPAYSTYAESRFLRMCGGDAVGMSNCWEVIVARHCGLRVLALCVITDIFNPNDKNPKDARIHDEILEIGQNAVIDLTKLLLEIIPKL